jgi:hypothetical protein
MALSLSGVRIRSFNLFVAFLLQRYRKNVKSDDKWGSRQLKMANHIEKRISVCVQLQPAKNISARMTLSLSGERGGSFRLSVT